MPFWTFEDGIITEIESDQLFLTQREVVTSGRNHVVKTLAIQSFGCETDVIEPLEKFGVSLSELLGVLVHQVLELGIEVLSHGPLEDGGFLRDHVQVASQHLEIDFHGILVVKNNLSFAWFQAHPKQFDER